MVASEATLTDWTQIIRSEYEEMPGLVLTCAQARRLWGLDCATCGALMEELVRSGFLIRRLDGAYGRATPVTRQF
jgi:hypothetical protein